MCVWVLYWLYTCSAGGSLIYEPSGCIESEFTNKEDTSSRFVCDCIGIYGFLNVMFDL